MFTACHFTRGRLPQTHDINGLLGYGFLSQNSAPGRHVICGRVWLSQKRRIQSVRDSSASKRMHT